MEASLLTALKNSQLAAGHTPEDLIRLVRQLPTVPLSAGEALLEVGDAADAVYLLTLGTLEVRGADGALLDTEAPGALVGEQALLPGGSSTRSASVVAATDCRLLRIDRETFAALLERSRAALQAVSDDRLRNRLRKQARPLRALLERGTPRSWRDGDVLFREGDPADGLHLVLGGVAEVAIRQDGEPVHIATVYPGQVFGEIGVLNSTPRTATVIARHQLRTIFVPADAARDLQDADPALASFLRSLLRSRELPRQGMVHQHAVVQGGEVCIQTVFSLSGGRQLVGLRTPGNHYTLEETDASAAETVRIGTTTIDLSADGRIVGFADQGDYEDIAGLQVLALDGTPLSKQQQKQLSRAAKAAAALAPDAVVCRCLNIERQTIQASIDQGAQTTAAVQVATGCGTGCGGCLRKVAAMLPGAAGAQARPTTPRLGPPQEAEATRSGGFMGWLRRALGS